MNIGTKERITTAGALAVMALIAAAIWSTNAEVTRAGRDREHASEIAQGLSELRLVTFEFKEHRQERARLQWHSVSNRIDRVLAGAEFAGPEPEQIGRDLRARRAASNKAFAELTAAHAGEKAGVPDSEAENRFQAQLLSRLLIAQQDSTGDAFRMLFLATERTYSAERNVMLVIVGGLVLIALLEIGSSWLVHRQVLLPIALFEQATRKVAAGDLDVELGLIRDDEIGGLARNFEAMVRSVRSSIVRIAKDNQELALLNNEMQAFSYSVSHDLRAPLRGMDGFALALLEDYGDKLDADGKDALDRIRAASQRMGRLIDDLLGLSRVTRADMKLKSVDLGSIAREICASLEHEQPGRGVVWEVEPGVTLQADPALIEIALRNLLENAWKFTGKTPGPVIRVGALDYEGGKKYFVADNGAGFDPAHASNLFGAFQRLHRADEFPGTGIGLAIVKRIISRHAGRLWAEAKPGAGATFFFTVGALAEDKRG
jgi:signal transduction histidine kinase